MCGFQFRLQIHHSSCNDFRFKLYMDLQTQYSKDFPYLKAAKGKNNFPCLVKKDFIKDGIYQCGICISDNANECYHTTVEYGPCMTNESFKDSRW